jgi:glutathione synthase/RimK-type ligase-like ATP-grasp enzyme
VATVGDALSGLDAAFGVLRAAAVAGGPRIALATCAEYPEGYRESALTEALARRRAEPHWVVWDAPGTDWEAFDLVVVRSTWDYPAKLDAFRAWVQEVAMATVLVNPPRLIFGNLHKGYLADLGREAVPTVVVPAGMTVDLGHLPWDDLVVKPAVGVGGFGAVCHATQDDLDALTLADEGAADAVVQPYVSSIEHAGELSVICIDAEPTHAVRKVPAAGEFRIHEHWGGTTEPIALTRHLADAAARALAHLGDRPAYARVDLLAVAGDLVVSELELVEPQLGLASAPEAVERFADCLVARAGSRSSLR